jgi:uncharacterized protein (TIGR03083 family)
MTTARTRYIEAWEQTIRSTEQVCAALSDQDWTLPTQCPGWSIQDVVAHLIGVERTMLGDRPLASDPVPDPPYVRNELGRYMEQAVQARRGHTPAQLLAELREIIERRYKALQADSRPLTDEVPGPMGPMSYERLLQLRIFDLWAHEQDIRRAVGRPGDLDGPAAEVARDFVLPALPKTVAKKAGAAPGSTVVFDVSGPVAFTRTVMVDDVQRGALVEPTPVAPTVRLELSWETFVQLACGRVSPQQQAPVTIHGDVELGAAVLAAMAVTP